MIPKIDTRDGKPPGAISASENRLRVSWVYDQRSNLAGRIGLELVAQ